MINRQNSNLNRTQIKINQKKLEEKISKESNNQIIIIVSQDYLQEKPMKMQLEKNIYPIWL